MSAEKETMNSATPLEGYEDEGVEGDDSRDESVGVEGDDPETVSALPLDQVFEVLKNERRRTVLRYLADHEEPVALGDLAEHVAANENDTPIKQISSRERKCAYVGLYQCHLPKMDDMDVIDFNQNRGLVETGPNAAQLEQYTDWAGEEKRPWPLYYGSAAGVGLVSLLTAGFLGSSVLPILIGLACLTAVVIVAVVHHRADA